jgi:hypothetical protein
MIVANVPTLGKFEKNLKHLLLQHKKKDFVLQASNKSAFSTAVLKVLRHISKVDLF